MGTINRSTIRAIFLSTLSLRRATSHFCVWPPHYAHFYPRSPCGERRFWASTVLQIVIFLSTLSLRRATYPSADCHPHVAYFYPRSPCGERRCSSKIISSSIVISIHALLAESDQNCLRPAQRLHLFLSTLSLRRATSFLSMGLDGRFISIHALLAESDHHKSDQWMYHSTISIHALLAESDSPHSINCMTHTLFLSTLSLRRATLL